MGWWPFSRRKPIIDNLHMKGSRQWLSDLQTACERNYDNHAEGQRLVTQMQVEWRDAHAREEITDELREGLDRRAFRLLRADAKEWLKWLDDETFWQPGWRADDS